MEIKRILNEINEAVKQVNDGEIDPFKVFRLLKILSKRIDFALDDIYEAVISESECYHKEELAKMGFSIQTGRKTWNYKNCKEWVCLSNQLKELEKVLQARTIQVGTLVNADSGEILEKPSWTTSKQSIIMSKEKYDIDDL